MAGHDGAAGRVVAGVSRPPFVLRGTRALLVHPGIYDDEAPDAFPPWGALYLGTALRAQGADVEVSDLNGADIPVAVARLLAEVRPHVVGVTAKLGRGALRMRQVVDAIRVLAPALPIAAGGPLVSSHPDPGLPLWSGVDALFLGDGEMALPRWVAQGHPPGLHGPFEDADLDRAGIPTWWPELWRYVRPASEWPNMAVPGIHVAAGRGCTRRCTFCYLNAHSPSRAHRTVSPERLLASMDDAASALSVTGFYFVDDCFVDAPPHRALELCRLLEGRGSPYRIGCDIQLHELDDQGLLAALYRAGFRCFYLGVEAASPDVRRRLRKGPSRGLRNAIVRATDMGFFIRASIGMGWPGETEQDVQDTLALVESLPDLLFDAYRYAPLPGAPLTARRGSTAMSPFADYSELGANHSDLSDPVFERLWRELQRRQDDSHDRYFPPDPPHRGLANAGGRGAGE